MKNKVDVLTKEEACEEVFSAFNRLKNLGPISYEEVVEGLKVLDNPYRNSQYYMVKLKGTIFTYCLDNKEWSYRNRWSDKYFGKSPYDAYIEYRNKTMY